MKTIKHLLVLATFIAFASTLHAFDPAADIFLDRFTLLTNGLIQWERGHLLSNGRFKSVTSETIDPAYLTSKRQWSTATFDVEPISGRPVLDVGRFNTYDGRWDRSDETFPFGFIDYVIVVVKGKENPNPIPAITQQPQTRFAAIGQDVEFNVVGRPREFLSYQWRFKGKSILNGAGDSLKVSNVQPDQAGLYTVALSAFGKTVKSKPALLKILKPVAIKTQPKSQTVTVGKSAVFRVGIQGSGPIAYQWFVTYGMAPIGGEIPGATKSFLTIPRVRPEDGGGYYYVRVSNPVSSVYSALATLEVSQ